MENKRGCWETRDINCNAAYIIKYEGNYVNRESTQKTLGYKFSEVDTMAS